MPESQERFKNDGNTESRMSKYSSFSRSFRFPNLRSDLVPLKPVYKIKKRSKEKTLSSSQSCSTNPNSKGAGKKGGSSACPQDWESDGILGGCEGGRGTW